MALAYRVCLPRYAGTAILPPLKKILNAALLVHIMQVRASMYVHAQYMHHVWQTHSDMQCSVYGVCVCVYGVCVCVCVWWE